MDTVLSLIKMVVELADELQKASAERHDEILAALKDAEVRLQGARAEAHAAVDADDAAMKAALETADKTKS